MKRAKKLWAALVAAALAVTSVQPAYAAAGGSPGGMTEETKETDYTQFVDPFVGTQVDYGQLYPGSVVPYGLMKLNADTYPHATLDHAGYDYGKSQIEGFTHTRIEGVGGQGAGGDILVTPTYVRYTKKPGSASRAMNIVKDRYGNKVEEASPGYYSVNLWPKKGVDDTAEEFQDSGSIKAELTSDVRTGYHRYTLPEDGEISLTVDMKYNYDCRNISRDIILDIEKSKDKTALSGRFSGRNVSGNGKYTMYFYMETSQPALDVETWDADGFGEFSGKTVTGDDVGAVLTFMGKKNTPLEIKVSVSPISAAQAKKDMYAEMPGWDFEEERAQAKQAWNDVLSKVKVTSSKTSDPDGTMKKLFYTHLYHMFTMPMNATSTDGTYRDISPDNHIKVADGYTHYDSWTLWDDFKKYPIIGLVLPDVYADIVRSVADGLEAGFATWSHNYQVVPNVRTEHAVALLADGVAKGMTDIPNLAAAYEKAKAIADKVSDSDRRSRVDKMVEYCYDDWAISLLAEELYEQTGEETYMDDYRKYAARAFMYKELYRADAVTPASQYQDMVGMGENPVGSASMGLLWGKNTDGSWKSGNPEQIGSGQSLYQGSLWQYTFWDTNDVSGLMDLMGGRDGMYRQLSYLMGEYDPENGARMLHTSDNEIDMHSPYLFNYVGRPYRTQYWTRQIYADQSFTCGYAGSGDSKQYLYKLRPDGYLDGMDDDAGTMASAYVAAAMGLFPVTPGDPTFQITSPFFEEIRLDVGNGKEFVIQSDNVSPENKYIQAATLNGEAFERTWLTYEEISRGGVIRYEMDRTPSDWAAEASSVPSMSDSVDSAVYEKDQLSYSSLAFVESGENDGTMGNTITISVQDDAVTVNGESGQEVSKEAYSISGLPEGLAVSLVKKDDKTLEMSLSGAAKKHKISDNTDSLNLELKDSLFTGAVTTKRRSQMLKIQYSDNFIAYSSESVQENEEGIFDETIVASISGDVMFSGSEGEDFVSAGKVWYSGLPQGVELSVIRRDPENVEFRFTGKITGEYEDRDGLKITFSDAAFVGDKADNIIGSNYGGMKTIRILSASMGEASERQLAIERLKEMAAEMRKMDLDSYVSLGQEVLMDALAEAEALLEDEAAVTLEQAKEMQEKLESAIAGLARRRNGFEKIEMEDFDDWSTQLHPDASNGGTLKLESTSDPEENPKTRQVANTFAGAWLKYGVDFGTDAPESVSIRYSASSSCYDDTAVELRLGSLDGETVASVPVPRTGSWSTYNTAKMDLTDAARAKLTGEQVLYLVFTGTHITNSKRYAGNFNWVKFEKAGAGEPSNVHDVTGGKLLEAEDFDSWDTTKHPSGNGPLKTENAGTGGSGQSVANSFDKAWLKFDKIDFGTEEVTKILINYKMKKNNCPADSRLEIRRGDPENGELLATVMAPEVAASGNWSDWTLASAEVTGEKLKGVLEDVYLVFRGDMSAHSSWYIFNLDYVKFEFKSVVQEPAGEELLEQLGNLYETLYPAKNKPDVQQQEDTLFVPLWKSLRSAERLMDSGTPDAGEVTETIGALSALEPLLVDVLLKGEMKTLIASAEALDESNTGAESLEGIRQALEAAKEVRKDDGYAAYAEAYNALKTACGNREIIGDKEALAALLKSAKAAWNSTGEYLTESRTALSGALEEAEAVLAQADAAQEQIEAAGRKLEDAMDQLIPVADRDSLEQSVIQARALLAQGTLQESVSLAVNEKLGEAERLLERASSVVAPTTKKEFSVGKKALDDVMLWAASLPSAAEMAEFEAMKAELAALDLSGYTEESAKAVRDALEKAEDLGEGITAEELEKITEELSRAKEGLEVKEEEIPVTTVTDSESGISVTGRIKNQTGFTVEAFSEEEAGYSEMKELVGGRTLVGAYTVSGLVYSGEVTVSFPTDVELDGKILTVLQKQADGTVTTSYSFAENGSVRIRTGELSSFMLAVSEESYEDILKKLQDMLAEVKKARDEAVEAGNKAEEERLAAEEAKKQAEIDKLAAEEAQRKAGEAQKQAEAAKAAAEEAQRKAEEAQKQAEAEKAAAEEAKKKAEEAQKQAEAEKAAAEEAREQAELSQKAAEEARRQAELSQKAAEEAQKAVEEAGAKRGEQTDNSQNVLEKGKTYEVDAFRYQVTSASSDSPTVTLTGTVRSGIKKAVIPATVKIQGVVCKVTKIGAKAFQKQKKLKKAVIGTNMKEIGARAFYGDKNLKTIQIKSKVLKKAGKNVFKGINSKAVVKVPKAKIKAYKKLLKGKGAALTIK